MIQVKLEPKLKKLTDKTYQVIFSSCMVFGICGIYIYSGLTVRVKPAIPYYLDWQYKKYFILDIYSL